MTTSTQRRKEGHYSDSSDSVAPRRRGRQPPYMVVVVDGLARGAHVGLGRIMFSNRQGGIDCVP